MTAFITQLLVYFSMCLANKMKSVLFSALLHCFIVVLLFAIQIQTKKCTTPNDETAKCISLYKCPVLLQALATQTNESIDFVRRSHCGRWNANAEPRVCCGSTSTYRINENKTAENTTSISANAVPTVQDTKNTSTQNVTKKPLSDKRFCGYQHTDDYFYTGNETAIDEFPWLAVFIYQLDDDLEEEDIVGHRDEPLFVQYGCAGTLINARYVLTAAQCLRLKVESAVAVRLGEYNIKKEQDCVTFSDLEDCSTVENVGFEEIIIHPHFDRRRGINDIALIRLNETVFFTDYIRPICLPIPGTMFAQPGELFTTTGFGQVSTDGAYTVIKKRIHTKLITNEECDEFYSAVPGRFRNVTENVICTLDLSNNTAYSCTGDSGAPVMLSRRAQWHMEGFAVWGTDSCGSEFPRVHTRVVNYLDWIEQNIRHW